MNYTTYLSSIILFINLKQNIMLLRSGKKVNEVYQTKDYSMFKLHKDNRDVNLNHVRKIANDMVQRGWLPGSYIVVNAKGETIDGQHRIEAAKIAGVPVSYIVENKTDGKTIRGLNSNQKKWQLQNHIGGFVKEGNQNYILLSGFMKMYPEFTATEAMMFVQNSYSYCDRDQFESGGFVAKDIDKATQWASDILLLKPYFKKFNSSAFVRAMIKSLTKCKQFKLEEFIYKVHNRPTQLFMCGTLSEYLGVIEDVYNFGRKKDNRIDLRKFKKD